MQDNRERTTNWRFAVLRGRQGFEALRPRWQALVDRLPQATYLQQPGWIAAYLDALATDDTIRFVTASRGDTLCGVLVLTRKAGGLKGWLVPEVQMISGPHMVLADLVGSISKLGANILNASSETKENKMVESHFTINVENTGHLDRILSAVRKVRQVQDARRLG